MVAALDAPPGIYNIVEERPLRRRELIEVFEDIAGRTLRTPPGLLTKFGPAKAMGRSLRLDNARFREATGWTPDYTSPADGLIAVAAEIDRELQT